MDSSWNDGDVEVIIFIDIYKRGETDFFPLELLSLKCHVPTCTEYSVKTRVEKYA